MRRSRSNQGFTLIEAMVGLACAMLVLLGAVGFAHYEVRTLGISRDNLEMTQSGRMALDLLMDDLFNAGVGVGYNEAGQFMGLQIGNFNRGAAAFNSDNNSIDIDHIDGNNAQTVGAFPTDDIGIMMAEGQHVTIVFWDTSGGVAQVCGPSSFTNGDLVLVRSADGLSARTISISGVNGGATCVHGPQTCDQGCEDVSFGPDPAASYSSGASAASANYDGGIMAGGFKRITWFVTDADPARPILRRAVGDCSARDDTCGDAVADFVDTLQMRVYERQGNVWADQTTDGITAGTNPVRVDLEMVLRSAHEDISGQIHPHARMVLEEKCLPGPDSALPGQCANTSTPNLLRRLVLRGSVEIKNAGRMRIN